MSTLAKIVDVRMTSGFAGCVPERVRAENRTFAMGRRVQPVSLEQSVPK
ncbi:hypothetical protein ACMHYB_23100 [Sorangium sp. So ce1128]